MIILMMSMSLALSQESIVEVPEGSSIITPEHEPFHVKDRHYLLPESAYDRCIENTEKLRVSETALGHCTENATVSLEDVIVPMEDCKTALQATKVQMLEDGGLIALCTERAQVMETSLLEADMKMSRLRKQRNTMGVVAAVEGVALVAIVGFAIAL